MAQFAAIAAALAAIDVALGVGLHSILPDPNLQLIQVSKPVSGRQVPGGTGTDKRVRGNTASDTRLAQKERDKFSTPGATEQVNRKSRVAPKLSAKGKTRTTTRQRQTRRFPVAYGSFKRYRRRYRLGKWPI